MPTPATILTALSLALTTLSVSADQTPFATGSSETLRATKKRPLKGRFLHITDFHPDPHYKAGATFESGCHVVPKKKKGKDKSVDDDDDDEEENLAEELLKGKGDFAGKWGSGVSDCDSPISLVNLTFDWLKKEWANEVDFVIWTGDNARHDIDRSLPRTPTEIFDLNRMMVDKMRSTFGNDVPIVPSIGNNDIYPHNVLAPGPNHITGEFLHIWNHFIPDDYRHVFERGAYFSVEVIPDRLAVISLNTLFWYDSNTLVDGCGDRSGDPGALEMDWLEVQLSSFRDRGMQVWLSGHVPPHMGHYYDNCYLRYGDLSLRYQDTIVGHVFGHMNIDHFFFIDVQELEATSASLPSFESSSAFLNASSSFAGPSLKHGPHLPHSGRYKVTGRSGGQSLQQELKKDFGEMPGPKVLKMQDYAVMNVAPSVIPTYFPGVRVFSYNITGMNNEDFDENLLYKGGPPKAMSDSEDEDEDKDNEEDDQVEIAKKRKGGHRHDKPKDDCSLPANEDKPHCTFKHLPRHYSKHSPSRSNRLLTPLGYTQFYLPDVDKNGKKEPEWVVEYTTFKIKNLLPTDGEGEGEGEGGGNDIDLPVPLHLLPKYHPDIFHHDKINIDNNNNSENKEKDDGEKKNKRKRKDFEKALQKITPFKMSDLTIESYIHLARNLVKEKKLWNKFSELMFVSSDSS